MAKKVVKLITEKPKINLQLNNRSNLFRLEMILNDLEELNIENANGSISTTEYYLRKSKIIKKLYSPDL